MQINFSERELEDFLCTGKNLEKYLGLKFIARQVSIPPAGIVDILAYSRDSDCFVIIELKKDLLDSNALLQGLAYLKYYQEVRGFNFIHRRRLRKFCLLLVGQDLALDLIKVVSNAEYDCSFSNKEIYYKLFNINFERGIEFDYFSSNQRDYEDKILDSLNGFEYAASDFNKK